MTPLSLAAQAQKVLDAVREICPAPADEVAAAAILAAADQVVPEGGVFLSTACAARIRAKFRAIAAELDGTTTTTES